MLKKGKTFSSKHLVIKYIKVENKLKKFACITSSKFSKKTTNQNKARRIIMRAAREKVEKFPNNYYFVFIPKKTFFEKGLSGGKINVDASVIGSQIDTFLSELVVL